jgi:hypothetical protein
MPSSQPTPAPSIQVHNIFTTIFFKLSNQKQFPFPLTLSFMNLILCTKNSRPRHHRFIQHQHHQSKCANMQLSFLQPQTMTSYLLFIIQPTSLPSPVPTSTPSIKVRNYALQIPSKPSILLVEQPHALDIILSCVLVLSTSCSQLRRHHHSQHQHHRSRCTNIRALAHSSNPVNKISR